MRSMGILDKIMGKTTFRDTGSLNYEFKKAGILRIILGVVVFIRVFQIVDVSFLLMEPKMVIMLGIAHLTLILLFTIGLLTPFVTTALLLTSYYFDQKYHTFTLGTAVLCMTYLPLLAIGSGKAYSLDAFVRRRINWYDGLLAKTERLVGASSRMEVKRAYFLAFLCYATISFGALLLHVQDPYWVQGLTTKSLLLNSYLCKYFEWFRFLDAQIPWLLSALSISAGIFQSVFQFLMVPLMYTSWGRKYVFFWGMNFFLISLFFINLSYLPHVEIILWLLIFLRPRGREVASQSDALSTPTPRINKVLYGTYLLGIAVYFMVRCPYTNALFPFPEAVDKKLNTFLAISGFDRPNVFNVTDLSMGDNWVEMYHVTDEGKALCPLIGEKGERLNYLGWDYMLFNNHNCDFLYFGTTLVFRRRILDRDMSTFLDEEQVGWRALKRRIRYDYLYRSYTGLHTYQIELYTCPMSQVSHDPGEGQTFRKDLVRTLQFTYDGKELIIIGED